MTERVFPVPAHLGGTQALTTDPFVGTQTRPMPDTSVTDVTAGPGRPTASGRLSARPESPLCGCV